MSKKKVYISGAITGLPFDEVQTKFAAAERILIQQGYEVVSPLKTGIPYNFPWESHITVDIVLLIGCEAVYLLQDWNLSKGATLEKNIAELTGKQIIYEKPVLFVEIKQAIYEVTRISFYEITGKRRNRKIVYARMIFSHYCKKMVETVEEIAEEIKHDRTTILYYLKKYEDDYAVTKEFRDMADRVNEIIGSK